MDDTSINKWFMGIAASVLIMSGAGQIAGLVALAEVKKDIAHIQESSKDRYTGSIAAQDKKIQDLVDQQQNLIINTIKEKQDNRVAKFVAIEERLSNLEMSNLERD